MRNYKIIITDVAEYELFGISSYIETKFHSVTMAKHILNEINQKIMLLSKFPYIGVKVENSNKFRIVVNKHLVFYTVDDNLQRVNIINIEHSLQNH